MTIEDIEKTLPSGFHDASLEKLNIDYVKREAKFEVSVDVGEPDSPREELREATRKGVLTISGLLFCVIEPPTSHDTFQKIDGLWIAGSGPVDSKKVKTKLPPLPRGVFAHYFFINEWNASIVVAASDARFEWS